MENKKLHERIIAGILLASISLAAYAGTQSGVLSASGTGSTEAKACANAKAVGTQMVARLYANNPPAYVTGFGSCLCSEDKKEIDSMKWSCNVDVQWSINVW